MGRVSYCAPTSKVVIRTSCWLSSKRKPFFWKSRTGSPLLRSWLKTSISTKEDCTRIAGACAGAGDCWDARGGEVQMARKQIDDRLGQALECARRLLSSRQTSSPSRGWFPDWPGSRGCRVLVVPPFGARFQRVQDHPLGKIAILYRHAPRPPLVGTSHGAMRLTNRVWNPIMRKVNAHGLIRKRIRQGKPCLVVPFSIGDSCTV